MGGRFHGRSNPPKEKKPLKDTFDLKTLRMKFKAKIATAMAVALAFASQTAHAQNVGVKANALSFAHTALGMGAEMSLGYHWSAVQRRRSGTVLRTAQVGEGRALRRVACRRWCDLWLPMGAGAPLERGGSSKRRLRAPALQEV